MTYKEICDAQELLDLIDRFDVPFWENVWCGDKTELENVQDALNQKNVKYLLFEEAGKPVALLCYIIESENVIELSQLDIEDYHFGRGNGYGKKVVRLFKKMFNKDCLIYGYSVEDAAEFWKRVATNYDAEVYNIIVENNYESGYLMRFEV